MEKVDVSNIEKNVRTKLNGPNSLYVVISDQGINKDEVVKPRATEKTVAPGSHSSKISIQLLAKKVNTPDILKYLPDGLLSAAQIEVKRKAIADTVVWNDIAHVPFFSLSAHDRWFSNYAVDFRRVGWYTTKYKFYDSESI